MLNDTLKTYLGGTDGGEIAIKPVPLYEASGEPNDHNVASYVALCGETVNIEDAYDVDQFDFSGTRKFDEANSYRSKSFLTVPMKDHTGEVIGVLQLINACDEESGEICIFEADEQPFVEALASQAAIALENRILLDAQKALTDSFIELIAAAIDKKSPYTGGHCERVPELAEMLAEAAAADEGQFKDFSLDDEQRYEYHIAGWLHDCGKVTTPEFVIDKATKLETIYNRVNEVRMRFEVMRRDAEIDYLKGMQRDGADEVALKAAFDARAAELEDDFAFIAECNIGGEFMDDALKERVHNIAQQTWTRYFDDRLGLSHIELERKERTPKPELPAQETILADKEEHIVYRTEDPYGDNKLGFTLPVPEYEYNFGELYNMCIARGTLSNEERFKINDHIIQTIYMLEKLPFPKHLKRAPEFAGGHHEKMDGTGYPRGFDKAQMSVQARIMGIADIFEALTATDRPYKKAKKLSEALKIMGFMNKDDHIDPELFELFLRAGVYKQYADEFLEDFQIDEVNIEDYLN